MTYEERFTLVGQRGQDGAYTRVSECHPADIFIGVESGSRALMYICPSRPPEMPNLSAIESDVKLRQDGRWALVLKLRRQELQSLFSSLAQDIDDAAIHRGGDLGQAVVARLIRWQSLLSTGTSGMLDDNSLRGLCAELAFLIEDAIPCVGPSSAISAWVGPYDAPKDFTFTSSAVEVKATTRAPSSVRISSLEQLTDCEVPLYLWTVPVTLRDVTEPSALSVSALVARVREVLCEAAQPLETFNARLLAAGYEERIEYRTKVAELAASSCFRVATDFPRLQRTTAPHGVTCCQYDIAFHELEKHRVFHWYEG